MTPHELYEKNSLPLVFILLILFFPVAGYPTQHQTDPYTILHNYYEAIGGIARLKSITTVYTEGTTEYDGLKGRFKSWEETPLRYRLEEDFTIISQIQGDDGQVSWRKDPNGKVSILRDEETVKRRKIALGFENFEHIEPTSSFFSVSYEGVQMVKDHSCYVVKIRNQLNKDILWNFIDQKTFLLIKSIDQQPDIEIHTLYSDYRYENSIMQPFHDESEILPRQKKETNQIEKQIVNLNIAPALFHVPPDTPRDYKFYRGNRAENIPFQFIENLIYLNVKTAKDTRLWLLDSGASMSIIDQKYVDEMGIQSKGTIKGYGFGKNFDLQFVTLPAFSVKGVAFGQQKIFSFKGLAEKLHEPECYGILGYDFLSRFVVKIDYSAKRLSLYDPKTFIYKGKGQIIDAPLKNGTFTLPMSVDGIYSGRWSVDIGSFNTSFHFPFAKTHNLFQKKGVYRISRGMGGEYLEKTIQFDHFKIGNHIIKKPLITIPDAKGTGATSSAELIGNIGNSSLRFFTLYMDYENQQLIFEKGSDFNKTFPKDNSGMLIGKTDQGKPIIVFISPGSPGEKAGFMEGDVIEKINKINLNGNSRLILIKELLRQRKGTKLLFEISRNQQRKNILLTLDNMYQN
jgi:hypothetical protein